MPYVNRPSAEGCGLWTEKEHERFLQAMALYPTGPWRAVAAFVGTRNVRQTMTHAQKHKQKIARHQRGLLTRRRKPRDDGDAKSSSDDSDASDASPVDHAPLSIRIPAPQVLHDDDDFDPLPLSDTSSFMSMLHGGLVTPLTVVRHALQDDEPFVLETPVVADCLDYLVRSFA